MKNYEVLFVVKPTLAEEETKSQVDYVKGNIEKSGGEIFATTSMGMRKLAYEIEKNKRGYYYVIYFKTEPTEISELERLFRINENIIRFMTVKYEKTKEVAAWNSFVKKADEKATREAEKAEEAPEKAEEAPEKAEEAPEKAVAEA